MAGQQVAKRLGLIRNLSLGESDSVARNSLSIFTMVGTGPAVQMARLFSLRSAYWVDCRKQSCTTSPRPRVRSARRWIAETTSRTGSSATGGHVANAVVPASALCGVVSDKSAGLLAGVSALGDLRSARGTTSLSIIDITSSKTKRTNARLRTSFCAPPGRKCSLINVRFATESIPDALVITKQGRNSSNASMRGARSGQCG